MKPTLLFRIAFLATGLLVGPAVLQAENLTAIKARMEQRQSSVDALKDAKIVGETNRGYLEPRASVTPPDEKTMSDENADRASVYSAIAAQTGASIDQVGKVRAQKIAASSKRGVWIQAPDGTWAEKQ